MGQVRTINSEEDAELAKRIITEVLEVYERKAIDTLSNTHLSPQAYESKWAERDLMRRVLADAKKIYGSAIRR